MRVRVGEVVGIPAIMGSAVSVAVATREAVGVRLGTAETVAGTAFVELAVDVKSTIAICTCSVLRIAIAVIAGEEKRVELGFESSITVVGLFPFASRNRNHEAATRVIQTSKATLTAIKRLARFSGGGGIAGWRSASRISTAVW